MYPNFLITAAAALLISQAALAQQPTPQSNTPAVNTPNTSANPGAPVPGANSFTEAQAKSRIESNGYTSLSGLQKDAQGVWRGTATKDGRSVSVSLDFQGNVVAR